MKNELRQGDSATLNIYYNSPLFEDGSSGLLGYAAFPWDYDDDPKDDGVGEHSSMCTTLMIQMLIVIGVCSHLCLLSLPSDMSHTVCLHSTSIGGSSFRFNEGDTLTHEVVRSFEFHFCCDNMMMSNLT